MIARRILLGRCYGMVPMSETEYIKGANLLPWKPFTSPLTDHDRAVIRELNKAQARSPEKARARIAKMLNKKSAAAEIAAGKRWNAIKNRWE